MEIIDDRANNKTIFEKPRIIDDRKQNLKKPRSMFSDITAGLIEGTDAAATLAHGMSMYIPTLAAEVGAIGRGIVDPNMTIREARDEALEAMGKITLQPGMITQATKDVFDVGQNPAVPENIVKKVSHGFEVLVPSKEIETGIAQGKELNIPGIPDEVWDVGAFGMAKFIELLAFKGYHEIEVKGFKDVKNKIKGIEKRGKYSPEEFLELSKRVEKIDLAKIRKAKVKAEAIALKNKLKDGIIKLIKKPAETLAEKATKEIWEKPNEKTARELQIEREDIKRVEEKNLEAEPKEVETLSEEETSKPFGDKITIGNENIPEFKTTEQAKEFGKNATSEQIKELKRLYKESLDKGKKIKLLDFDAKMKEATRGQFFREAFEAAEAEKSKTPKDIIKEDLKPAEPEVEEGSVFQEELNKIEKGEEVSKPFGDKITKGDEDVPKILEKSYEDKNTSKREAIVEELIDENNQPILTDRIYKQIKEPEQIMEELDVFSEVMREWIENPDDGEIVLMVEKEIRTIASEVPMNNAKYELVNDYIDKMLTGIDHIKIERDIGDRAKAVIDAEEPLEEKLKIDDIIEDDEGTVSMTMKEILELDEELREFEEAKAKTEAKTTGGNVKKRTVEDVFDFLNNDKDLLFTEELPPEILHHLQELIKKVKENNTTVKEVLEEQGYSEKNALLADELIKMKAQEKFPDFRFQDFKSKVARLEEGKRTATRMEIEKQVRDNTPLAKLNKFYRYLLDIGVVVRGYKKGSYKLPQHMKTGINVRRVPKIISNNFKENLRSPYYQFKQVFDVLDNPSIDMQQSNIAYDTNVKNYLRWKKDLLKTFNKGRKIREKRIREVLEPVYEKYRPALKRRGSLLERRRVIESQLKKSSKNKKELYEKRLKHVKEELKKLGEKFKELPRDYDRAIPQLYDDPVVKATLHAGDQLPKDIELSAEELFLSRRLREYFLTKKEHLLDVGLKVEEKTYMTRLWESVMEDSSDNKIFKTIFRKLKSPEVLSFQRQMPNGRIWIPDANQILDFYIPMVEKKLAYQPFFNRFAETMAGVDTPLLNFYNKWINENLYRKQVQGISRILDNSVNALVDFEYVRLIGASLSVGFKHLVKLSSTYSNYDIRTNLKASKLAFKAAGQALKKTVGIEPKGVESKVIDAFLKQRQIVAELDQMPGFKEGSKRIKTLIAQPTVAIEAFENGVNVMASIISGMNKLPVETVHKAIWQNILETNFRGFADQPLWMKGTFARATTMFTMTPLKLLEYKYELVKGALKGEQDVFGTKVRTKLIRYMMYVGLAESIARANDTSVLELFLHPPFISHFIRPTKSGYEFHRPDIYMSPALDLYKSLSNKGLLGGTEEHFQYWGTASKIMNLKNKKYPTRYYDSWAKQLIGLQSIEKPVGQPRSRKRKNFTGFKGGFGSGI